MIRRNDMKQMKRHIFIFLSLTFTFFLLFNNLSSQQTAGELFEKALYLEEAKGELEKAIDLYKKILEQFTDNREVAARAQLHVGLCYEKLGLKEAPKAYQKVVNDFPEQTEVVNMAKEKLSVLLKAKSFVEKGDKEFKIQQVWSGPGLGSWQRPLGFMGRVSPDGRYLAFEDAIPGSLGIFELATKKKRRLIAGALSPPHEIAVWPRWSPDSSHVAYTCVNPNPKTGELPSVDIRIVSLDGSKRRVLYKDNNIMEAAAMDWSPDSKYILAGSISKDMIGRAILISVEDGSVRVLKSQKFSFDVPARIPGLVWLFSPDSRYIVYDYQAHEDSPERDIFLLSSDGSLDIPLIEHPADDYVLGWDPDRKGILFASDRRGTWDAWFIRVDEGKTRGNPVLIKKDIGKISPIGFTKGGSFYYGLQTPVANVYTATVDLEKGKILTPPTEAIQRLIGSNSIPSWSPDGKQLAYKSVRSPGVERLRSEVLCIRSTETGKDRELHPQIQKYWPLRWSPDGRFIFTTEDRKKIFKIDTQTEDVTLIVESDSKERISVPTLSTDGKKIFYLNWPIAASELKRRYYRIVEYDLVTRQEKELYRDPDWISDLALSPDGQYLSYLKRDSKRLWRILEVIPVGGGEPREFLKFEKGGGITTFAWMPDGKKIIYSKGKTKEKDCELWQISADGGEPQKLGGLGMDRVYFMSVHPDGRRIAFYTRGESTEIWVMENFLPEKK